MFCLATLFVVAVCSTSSSSVRAAIDQCTGGGCIGYTINHVYGSDGPTTYNELPASQETLKGDTGRPGKEGPQGVPGTVGEKGVRGDTGLQGAPCQCDNTELNKLKEEVAALSSSMNVSDEKFERKLEEVQENVNKTNNELQVSDEKFERNLVEIQKNYNKTYNELRANVEKLEHNVIKTIKSLQKLSNHTTDSDESFERKLVEIKENFNKTYNGLQALDEKLEHNVTEAFANLHKLSNHTTVSDEKFETKLVEIQNNFNKTYIELRGNDEKLEHNITEAFASLQNLWNHSTDEKFQKNLVEIEENFTQVYNRFSHPKSCATVLPRRSGFYLISPEPKKVLPFSVYCNFSGSNEVWTAIGHDSVNEVEVTCEPSFCHKHNVSYAVSMNQIKALIKVSRSCRQYIKYRCMRSVILNAGGSQYAAWISRDGEQMNYWGGARSDRYCPCGVTGTCTNPSKKCNCDQKSSPETSDEGYIFDKSKLPVTAMWFGDAGDSGEWGRHSLGKLECSDAEIDIPESCVAVGTSQSGSYLISPEPNKVHPFYVYCNFSSGNEVWTTINHDSLNEVEVTCENPFCHKHNVNYAVSMDQIKALINISRSCRQYIKYRCMSSVF